MKFTFLDQHGNIVAHNLFSHGYVQFLISLIFPSKHNHTLKSKQTWKHQKKGKKEATAELRSWIENRKSTTLLSTFHSFHFTRFSIHEGKMKKNC